MPELPAGPGDLSGSDRKARRQIRRTSKPGESLTRAELVVVYIGMAVFIVVIILILVRMSEVPHIVIEPI